MTAKLSKPATYGKAIVGTAAAFVGALVVGATDGHLTLVEWLVAAGAGLAAAGGVFGVQNADADE